MLRYRIGLTCLTLLLLSFGFQFWYCSGHGEWLDLMTRHNWILWVEFALNYGMFWGLELLAPQSTNKL